MRKPTIQFKKTDFETLDNFLKNNFSERKSNFKVYLERQIKPFSWSGKYIKGPVSDNPWIIIKKEKHIKIGEIMYQPGPEKDSMIFETESKFNFLVHQLIDEIINVLEFYGFAEVTKHTELDGSIKSSQNKKNKVGHPGLPTEEWADRIEKVIEGKDLKEENPTLQWNQIPGKVGWYWGEITPTYRHPRCDSNAQPTDSKRPICTSTTYIWWYSVYIVPYVGMILSTVSIFSMFSREGCTAVAPEHEEGKATSCPIE